MSTKKKLKVRFLIFTGFVAMILIVVVVLAWRDVDSPDVSDLLLENKFISDGDNAYFDFCNATNFFDHFDNAEIQKFLSDKESDASEISKIIKNNSLALQEIRKGLEKEICRPPAVTSFSDNLPHLTEWRKFALLFTVDARLNFRSGDLDKAVESAISTIQFGYMIQNDSEVLITFLVGDAIMEMGLKELRHILESPDIQMKHLDRISKSLKACNNTYDGYVSATKGEFRVVYQTIDALDNGDMPFFGTPFQQGTFPAGENFGRIFFKRNKTMELFAGNTRNLIESGKKPFSEYKTYDPLEKLVKQPDGFLSFINPNFVGNVFLKLVAPPNILKKLYALDFSISGTELLVILKKYQFDKGKTPEKLEDLVPGYLDKVPLDPYDGKPIRYVSEKKLIYSIGPNLEDQTLVSDDKSPDDIVFQIK